MLNCLSFKQKATAKKMAFSIFPWIVYKTKSKISGEIEVKEQLENYTLHVGGLIQSGGIIEGIWKKPLRFAQGKLSVSNCLILGLGGGTVVQLIKSHWPGAKIVGIEIDPEIIKIGKKFFGLGEIKNLKIIKANAFEWVGGYFNDLNHQTKFDLIIVDLYLGDQFPKKAENDEFLKNIKKLLSQNGVMILNRLKGKSEKNFEEKLKKIFPTIIKVEIPTNLFFMLKLKYV